MCAAAERVASPLAVSLLQPQSSEHVPPPPKNPSNVHVALRIISCQLRPVPSSGSLHRQSDGSTLSTGAGGFSRATSSRRLQFLATALELGLERARASSSDTPKPRREHPWRERAGGGAGPGRGSAAGAAAGCAPPPYEHRVRWLRESQSTLRERRPQRAGQLLRLLSQDLGLEGLLLTDILCRNVAFLSLLDPISHDLLVHLAWHLQCPRSDCELWESLDKTCRQLLYHLPPHAKRQRGASLPRRKTQSCLKGSLQKTLPAAETMNLPRSVRAVQHIARSLGSQGAGLAVLDLSFTGLSDALLRRPLPRLPQLLLNGNRAAARELTEAVKDTAKFPALAWVGLGHNVDVASLPQPLVAGLHRRLSQRTSLPTIYEGLDLEPEGGAAGASALSSGWGSAAAGPGPEPQVTCHLPRLLLPDGQCCRAPGTGDGGRGPRPQAPMQCAEEDGLTGGWMAGPAWSLSLLSAGGARHLLCRPHNKG
ncbi:leucine-rich repeat-containing protein 75B [Hippopotamus amphibius kiboko]|uniref:leucine-rich repeat-containing protein 75B n=1 Tax=Hippopotamus amphibius kiboko TaxID=575201 RepID=UPI002599BAC9|nr:leucine-rich repeat-containing protein 75B [Hippopotamus amphibius kiboko]